MSTPLHTLHSILQTHHCSLTKQRQRIFDLMTNREPVSMHELLQEVAGTIDKVSVYRTISLFEELGIVQRVNSGWKYKLELSDQFSAHHHHLTCLGCQKIINISESTFETFIENLSAQHHFMARTHQLEVEGYCKTCQKRLSKTE